MSLAFIIVILGAIGFVRRCSGNSGDIVNEYVKPGGDTIAVAIEMSPLTYTMRTILPRDSITIFFGPFLHGMMRLWSFTPLHRSTRLLPVFLVENTI